MSSLRLPQHLISHGSGEASDAAFRHEVAEEQAASLGRAGRRLEEALAALHANAETDARPALLKSAADAAWSLMVQREAIGLRDRARFAADYAIPREVMVRLGAR